MKKNLVKLLALLVLGTTVASAGAAQPWKTNPQPDGSRSVWVT